MPRNIKPTTQRKPSRQLKVDNTLLQEKLRIYQGLLKFTQRAFNDYFEGGDDKRLIQARNAINQTDI